MKDFIRSLKFKILVGILALLMGIMVYAATTAGGRSLISSFFGAVVSPFQKASSAISNKVSTTIDMLVNADNYYDENKELKKKLDELYVQMVDYENLKEENAHYKEILGLKEEYPDFKFSPPCKVIGRTTNDIYQTFVIDKGSRDGIELNDPVVTGDGIVGIVSEVQLSYSKVTTILSPKYTPGVISIKSKDTGTLEGSYEYAEDGLTRMRFISRDSKIEVGEVIVTSGHNGLVPRDRIVGVVERVELDKGGLSLNAIIRPMVDIENITNVFVITEFEGQGQGYDD
jgi:rod shape-determining protein MreC